MAIKTEISWTDSTWSPIRVRVKPDAGAIAKASGYASLIEIGTRMAGRVGQHCEHVSPGCENCYAGANNHRCLPENGTGLPYDRRSRDLVEAFVDERVLLEPLKWKPLWDCRTDRHCNKIEFQRPRRIFVENQSDLFGEWVTDDQIDQVFAVMALCPQHTFQVLTKRPERMLRYFEKDYPLPNVWQGVSVENQKAADVRIPLLLQTPAAVRFISAEPLLGPVNLEELPSASGIGRHLDALSNAGVDKGALIPNKLDWCIIGGESGPGARPMNPDWARSLRDQCQAAKVAFFMKQMGSAYGPKKGHEPPADLDIKQFPEAR
jgi:protein gp37